MLTGEQVNRGNSSSDQSLYW